MSQSNHNNKIRVRANNNNIGSGNNRTNVIRARERQQIHDYETSDVASYFLLFQFISQKESILSIIRNKQNE